MQQITHDVWNDKYRWGTEQSLSDTRTRIAKAIYANDPSKEAFDLAHDLLQREIISPGGRIQAGAGTGKRVTLINCYVSPTIQDSMMTVEGQDGQGIMDALKTAAVTSQQGGGIGMDFSTIRPNGAIVRRTGSVSSGILPFMDMWNSMCGTIKSSGARRGAMMGTLACWHPDVIDFITAKRQEGRLTNFNMSVLVTDEFMRAVKDDRNWDLEFPVEPANTNAIEQNGNWYTYKRLPARQLWEMILRNTYIHAEPGVIFIDRVNAMNNLAYCEEIHCTNPCFAADTLIVTDQGARPIKDLVGQSVTIWDGSRWVTVDNFRETGRNQPMLRIELQDGSSLRVTPYHSMLLEDGTHLEARQLAVGYRLQLSDVTYSGSINEPGAYLKGFLLGDGCVSADRPQPKLYLYEPKWGCRTRLIASALEIESGNVNTSAIADVGFVVQQTDTYSRLSMTGLAPRGDVLRLWCSTYKERLPVEAFKWSWKSKSELLTGLFDADGSIMDSAKAFGYQLSSIHREFLIDVQTLLKSVGVRSKLGLMKEGGHSTRLPGRVEGYQTQDCWRLTVAQAGSIRLSQICAFSRLKPFMDRQVKNVCKSRAGQIVSITEDGVDDVVYCCTVPDTHMVATAIGVTTSQCGEQPMPPNGACNLGHVNLAQMVTDPFTSHATFRWTLLETATRCMVRFLDNVLNESLFPTPEQELEAINKRREGIGYTGLANALQMLGIRYGSAEAIRFVEAVGQTMRNHAYDASVDLAIERGPFPLFDRDQYCKRPFIRSLSGELQDRIKEYGIRNGVLLTIAPTGNTSILLGNVSSGIEPSFCWEYGRKALQQDGSWKQYDTIYDYGYLKFRELVGKDAPLPDYFVTAADLTVDEHLAMQAAAQKYIDASISKTINCPVEMTYEEFAHVYQRAYDLGLKGVTTYRPDPASGRGAILTAKDKDEPKEDIPSVVPMEEIAEARRYRFKWPSTDSAFYVTISDYTDAQGVRRPFEIFINTKSVEHDEWIKGVTRMMSAIFRREKDVKFVVEELKSIYSTTGGIWRNQHYVASIVAMIGAILQEHLEWLGLLKDGDHQLITKGEGPICPKCNAPEMVNSEGCEKCNSCGYSKCGG